MFIAKHLLNTITFLFFSIPFFGQSNIKQADDDSKHRAVFISKATHFRATPPLTEMNFKAPQDQTDKAITVKNKFWGHKTVNPNPKPYGTDPVWQKTKSSHLTKAPIQNWDGMSSLWFPPDPTGAVGPNHYVQMTNTKYQVFDKEGNSLFGPVILSTLLGDGNAGDPIALYDKTADRWFLSQFDFSNKVVIAISQTPDPLGAYYVYEFQFDAFPDYPKYSIWQDGYYLTANMLGETNRNYALDRTKMLAGDPDAGIQGFTLPNLNEGSFFGVLPTHASSALPAPGTPNYFVYMQDDAWQGVSQDHIKVWELSIDWKTPSNSFMSNPISIPTSSFSTPFGIGEVTQPGTPTKLDAFSGIVMYMAQYREFPTHQSIVMNFAVDVNASLDDHIGVRWIELRKTGEDDWTIYQEGTYAPDDDNRWCASIHMDYQGNIALAYHVSGEETFLSLRYTGRYAEDPLGQMTLDETEIIAGTNSQTNSNRNGDYSHMTIDPTDDATFWYTGEYFDNNQRKTRITSFKMATALDKDIGVTAISNPSDGLLSDTETLTVSILNFGVDSVFNFPVSYQIDGDEVFTDTILDTLYSSESMIHSFSQTADLSVIGSYNIKAFTGYLEDEYPINDTTFATVTHLQSIDLALNSINNPISGVGLSADETVEVTIENTGGLPVSDFELSYFLMDEDTLTESFIGELAPGESTAFTFVEGVDLSQLGSYELTVFITLDGDGDQTNNQVVKPIEHLFCQPETDCDYGDGIKEFILGTISNYSGCEENGFSDFTFLSTDLDSAGTYDLTLSTGFGNQFVTVWIDFNKNFTYEPEEKVVSDYVIASGSGSGTFTETMDLVIPDYAVPGDYVLRAKTNWDNPVPEDACQNTPYGETEDYSVSIVPAVIDAMQNNALTLDWSVTQPVQNQFQVYIPLVKAETTIQILNTMGQVMSTTFNIKKQTEFNQVYNLNDLPGGMYFVKLSSATHQSSKKIQIIH